MPIPRCVYDENQPSGSLSVSNLRNTLRALWQCDLMPLRPRASRIIEPFEYGSDSALQAEWSGTGVTVTTSTTKQEGNNAMQCVIDVTGDRVVSKTVALDLSLFASLTLWEQVDVTVSEFQFYVKDSLGNESYWDIISNATPSTYQQDTLDLTTPDSDSGTPADLTDIVEIGYLGLDASKTYLFDTIKVLCGLNVWVEGGTIADFYQHVYLGEKRIDFAVGSSPAITPPSANPRIDLLVLNSTTLEWVEGEEASSPVEPTFPSGKIPICLVYQRVGMVKVVDYEDKDGNPTEGYILKDVRPFLQKTSTGEATLLVAASNSSQKSKAKADYICDGVSDNVEIQSAIDDLPAIGGKIFLAEGTYNIANTINITKNNVNLSGFGDNTLLFLSNNSNCNIILIEGKNNIRISSLQIDGNGANQSSGGIGINFYVSFNSIIDYCHIKNTKSISIYLKSFYYSLVTNSQIDNGIELNTRCYNNIISNNRIYRLTYNAIICTESFSEWNVFTGNDLVGAVNVSTGTKSIVNGFLIGYPLTWNPGSLADGAGETSAGQSVTGAVLGDLVLVSAPYDLQGIIAIGYVSSADIVKIRLQNETGGTIDLASGTWRVRVLKHSGF